MRVRCSLCQFEDNGFCAKKAQRGKPIKIKLNKSRTCAQYSEDALRVMESFRKRETHRKTIRHQQERKAAINKALREVEAARARVRANEAAAEVK